MPNKVLLGTQTPPDELSAVLRCVSRTIVIQSSDGIVKRHILTQTMKPSKEYTMYTSPAVL